jgi:hypothetical protein
METSKDFNNFVMTEIQARRSRPAGLQHRDDPRLLLEVMQTAMMRYPQVELTPEEVQKIYDYFAQEGVEYHNRFSSYVQVADYQEYLKDIRAMLDRMAKRNR